MATAFATPKDATLDTILASRLSATAKLIILAMVRNWAWVKDHCWPSDATIAAKIGRSAGQVQRALRELERAGYISREKTDEVPNGRRIWLLWRLRAGAEGPPAPARTTPSAPARSEPAVIVSSELNSENSRPLRLRPEAPRTAPEAPRTAPEALPDRSPVPSPEAPRTTRRPLGFDLAELVQVVGETADPILAAEIARRTAPPAPPEPATQTLPTPELIGKLPGRHDLIMPAARRLAEETGDFKPASMRTFEKMAGAVASRSVPADTLLDCWQQGMSPEAREKGKVLVAAWKRESGPEAPGPDRAALDR